MRQKKRKKRKKKKQEQAKALVPSENGNPNSKINQWDLSNDEAPGLDIACLDIILNIFWIAQHNAKYSGIKAYPEWIANLNATLIL